MMGGILFILALSIVTAQGTVIKNADTTHKRVARSPCVNCDDGVPPPPPEPVMPPYRHADPRSYDYPPPPPEPLEQPYRRWYPRSYYNLPRPPPPGPPRPPPYYSYPRAYDYPTVQIPPRPSGYSPRRPPPQPYHNHHWHTAINDSDEQGNDSDEQGDYNGEESGYDRADAISGVTGQSGQSFSFASTGVKGSGVSGYGKFGVHSPSSGQQFGSSDQSSTSYTGQPSTTGSADETNSQGSKIQSGNGQVYSASSGAQTSSQHLSAGSSSISNQASTQSISSENHESTQAGSQSATKTQPSDDHTSVTDGTLSLSNTLNTQSSEIYRKALNSFNGSSSENSNIQSTNSSRNVSAVSNALSSKDSQTATHIFQSLAGSTADSDISSVYPTDESNAQSSIFQSIINGTDLQTPSGPKPIYSAFLEDSPTVSPNSEHIIDLPPSSDFVDKSSISFNGSSTNVSKKQSSLNDHTSNNFDVSDASGNNHQYGEWHSSSTFGKHSSNNFDSSGFKDSHSYHSNFGSESGKFDSKSDEGSSLEELNHNKPDINGPNPPVYPSSFDHKSSSTFTDNNSDLSQIQSDSDVHSHQLKTQQSNNLDGIPKDYKPQRGDIATEPSDDFNNQNSEISPDFSSQTSFSHKSSGSPHTIFSSNSGGTSYGIPNTQIAELGDQSSVGFNGHSEKSFDDLSLGAGNVASTQPKSQSTGYAESNNSAPSLVPTTKSNNDFGIHSSSGNNVENSNNFDGLSTDNSNTHSFVMGDQVCICSPRNSALVDAISKSGSSTSYGGLAAASKVQTHSFTDAQVSGGYDDRLRNFANQSPNDLDKYKLSQFSFKNGAGDITGYNEQLGAQTLSNVNRNDQSGFSQEAISLSRNVDKINGLEAANKHDSSPDHRGTAVPSKVLLPPFGVLTHHTSAVVSENFPKDSRSESVGNIDQKHEEFQTQQNEDYGDGSKGQITDQQQISDTGSFGPGFDTTSSKSGPDFTSGSSNGNGFSVQRSASGDPFFTNDLRSRPLSAQSSSPFPINPVSQGSTSFSQSGCTNCAGTSSYALSNARSKNRDAIAVSVGL